MSINKELLEILASQDAKEIFTRRKTGLSAL